MTRGGAEQGHSGGRLGGELDQRLGDFGEEVDEFHPDLMPAESGALAPPNLGLDAHAVFGVVQLDYVASSERAPGANTNTTQRQIEDGPQVVLEELGLEPNRSPVP